MRASCIRVEGMRNIFIEADDSHAQHHEVCHQVSICTVQGELAQASAATLDVNKTAPAIPSFRRRTGASLLRCARCCCEFQQLSPREYKRRSPCQTPPKFAVAHLYSCFRAARLARRIDCTTPAARPRPFGVAVDSYRAKKFRTRDCPTWGLPGTADAEIRHRAQVLSLNGCVAVLVRTFVQVGR